MIKYSPYYDEDNFNNFIKDKKAHFSLLSTNVESANAKINELIIFIEQLREINFDFFFSVICLQECWITKELDISHLNITGYTCICQCTSVGRKGGLITCLNDKFVYKLKSNHESSDWECQFIETGGNGLNKTIILGNIYRPTINLNENIRMFNEKLPNILTSMDNDNSDIFLIYTSTIKSPSAVQMSKSIKQTQSVDKVYYNTRV